MGKETVAINAAKRTGTKKSCASLRPVTRITTAAAVTRMRVACSLVASLDIKFEERQIIMTCLEINIEYLRFSQKKFTKFVSLSLMINQFERRFVLNQFLLDI
jgi:hypothetical protein